MLLDWINDNLEEMRIVVKNIAEDLYDGHILAIFVGNYFLHLTIKVINEYCPHSKKSCSKFVEFQIYPSLLKQLCTWDL